MISLQNLYQPRAVIRLLIVCLILEMAYGQDNRNNLSLNMELSQMKRANEFMVELTVTNNVNKSIGVKVSTEDNPNIIYLSAHARYIACICSVAKFFWKIHVSGNALLQKKVEVVSDKDICHEGDDLILITVYIGNVTYKMFAGV